MPIARVNGASLRYEDRGTGTPVLFIHPPLLNSAVFDLQTSSLAGSCRVIAFDIRGHGGSAPSSVPVSYPLIAEDIKQLMDMLDVPQALLCGYSTGGGVALEFMLTHPQRCSGAVLVSAMPRISDAYNRLRLGMALTAAKLGAKKLMNAALAYGNADCAATFRHLYEHARPGDLVHWRDYFHEAMCYDCCERLRKSPVRLPITLVYGSKDRSFHRYARELERLLPESEAFLLQGVGHQIPTKAPDALNALLEQRIKA